MNGKKEGFYFTHYCVECGQQNLEQSRYCRNCAPLIRKKQNEIKQLTQRMSFYVQDEQLKTMLEKASVSLLPKFDLRTGKRLTKEQEESII